MVGEVRYEYKLEEFRYWYYWRYTQGNAFLPVPSNKSGFDGFTGPLLQNRAGKERILYGVASKPLDVEEAKETLRGAVPDLDVYLDKGQIEIIPTLIDMWKRVFSIQIEYWTSGLKNLIRLWWLWWVKVVREHFLAWKRRLEWFCWLWGRSG